MTDWADHPATVFLEVRSKRFIEMRRGDGCGWGNPSALPDSSDASPAGEAALVETEAPITGKTFAEDLLEAYETRWNRDILEIFEECCY